MSVGLVKKSVVFCFCPLIDFSAQHKARY